MRLAESGRATFRFWLDGQESAAPHGDTVLTAVATGRATAEIGCLWAQPPVGPAPVAALVRTSGDR